MLIVLAGQPEAEREGAPLPNCFPLLEQLVLCLSPQTSRGKAVRQVELGRRSAQGFLSWGCSGPPGFQGRREGSGIGARDGLTQQRDLLLDSVRTVFSTGPCEIVKEAN